MITINGRPRNLPQNRINAYECELDMYGKPVRKGYVYGWYGFFTVEKLRSEVMQKLTQYAAKGRSYPFLVTSHRLDETTTVNITLPSPPKKARISDMQFSRRRRSSPQNWVAVVLSPTKFTLL